MSIPRFQRLGTIAPCALLLLPVLLVPASVASGQTGEGRVVDDAAVRCAALGAQLARRWPDQTTSVQTAALVPAGLQTIRLPFAELSLQVPEHCELQAQLQPREGALGQRYSIQFHLRLPSAWNGRLLFQGGGGSNGERGDALGRYSAAAPSALQQGYAVVSQDSGHDNRINNDPAHAGTLVFGFDAEARSNYGHASLPRVADAARAALGVYYAQPPHHSYFVGCSKGGAEGLALAQRYADRFDGVVAGAPAMSLPRAAVAEAWDTQALAAAVPVTNSKSLRASDLQRAFSDVDLGLVRSATLAACDSLDGLQDGLVASTGACGTARVRPYLRRYLCRAGASAGCLRSVQLQALLRVMDGARDTRGRPLYSDWPWDPGMSTPGWRQWKLGDAQMPARNILLGGASLASVFTTPPTALPADADAQLRYLLGFDFDRDVAKIHARNAEFPRSAWEDIAARSSDLDAFRARHGRLIVYHGVADPVFSFNDSAAWWREVNRRYRGRAAETVRLFAVPGMTHCGGGETTDQFDALAALVAWVEEGRAPDSLLAKAGPTAPWPGRERPLCPYPATARYLGQGDPEKVASYRCR